MEKNYKRKAFRIIMLSPLLASLLAKFLFVLMGITLVWDGIQGYYIYLISFDISLKIWGLFTLWEQIKKDKTNIEEVEKQLSESNGE